MARNESYDDFVEKFKPKRTTDDCFTPPAVYAAVADWVRAEYALGDAPFLRPFKPGGNYEGEEVPPEAVVVDNPPFSILSKVLDNYRARGVRFFLFCPCLTATGYLRSGDVTALFPGGKNVVYENGAVVSTAFVTNLRPAEAVRLVPSLGALIAEAQAKAKAKAKAKKQRIVYPDVVFSSARLNALATVGVGATLTREQCAFVRKVGGVGIYGSGILVHPLTAEGFHERERHERERHERKRANLQVRVSLTPEEAYRARMLATE